MKRALSIFLILILCLSFVACGAPSDDGLGEIENLKAESFHGDSRFDFAFQRNGRQGYLEVKGVTLENDGICAFPDAPTL